MITETYDTEPKLTTLTKVILVWLLAAIAVGVAIVVASVLKSQGSIIGVICVSGLALSAATATSFKWADQPASLSDKE